MYLVKTRDGKFYELWEVKDGEWMIRNNAGEKVKVLRFGDGPELRRGVPVFVNHKEKEDSTQAITEIYRKI
jgi:hypothetical protein